MQGLIRKEKQHEAKWWVGWVFLGFVWFLIISMARDLWLTRRGFERIKESERRLESVLKENQRLVAKFTEVSSDEHKEKLIREKLNMQRTDEVVVVLPKKLSKTIGSENEKRDIENWEKWKELVFYRDF